MASTPGPQTSTLDSNPPRDEAVSVNTFKEFRHDNSGLQLFDQAGMLERCR
jgi:hypothetical protein